jgi:hypothetical protein
MPTMGGDTSRACMRTSGERIALRLEIRISVLADLVIQASVSPDFA